MRVKRKMFYRSMLIFILTGLLAGCGNQGSNSYSNDYYNNSYNDAESSADNTDSSSDAEDSTDMDYVPVTDYDGWWYLEDSSSEGTPLFAMLMVDADSLTWAAYDTGENEIASGDVSVTVGTTNAIVLDFSDSITVELQLIDKKLVTQDGVTYSASPSADSGSDNAQSETGDTQATGSDASQTTGSEDLQTDVSLYAGYWYDPSYEKYVILFDDYTYIMFSSGTIDSDGLAIPDYQGVYSCDIYTDVNNVSQVIFNFDTGNGILDGLTMILIDNAAMLDPYDNTTYYVKEDMIGQTQGNIAAMHCTLLLHSWYSAVSGTYLTFDSTGRVSYAREDSNGSIGTEVLSGSYTVEESEVNVSWIDGAVDYIYFTEDGIMINISQEVFTMK